MRIFSFLFFMLWVFSFSYGQTLQSNRLSGDITWEYQSYSLTQNPIPIIYTVFPNGNVADYEYSWRLKSGDWGDFSDATTFSFDFDCNAAKTSECVVLCKIRDKNTKQTQIVNLSHTVEICFLRKHEELKNSNPNE